MKIKYIDLFSGIGGFTVGIENAGVEIESHFFSEKDKFATANYKYNFPDAIPLGDINSVDGTKIERADLVTFGFPCQDMSLSGERKGFTTGEKSILFFEATRILRENQAKSFIWENVSGLMSSDGGKDLDMIFKELYNSGYLFDIQLINTKWFLPQNRPRLYCVGHNIRSVMYDFVVNGSAKEKVQKVVEGKLLNVFPAISKPTSSIKDLKDTQWVFEYMVDQQLTKYKEKFEFIDLFGKLNFSIIKKIYGMCFSDNTKKPGNKKNVLTLLEPASKEPAFWFITATVIYSYYPKTLLEKKSFYSKKTMDAMVDILLHIITITDESIWSKAKENLIQKQKDLYSEKDRYSTSENDKRDGNDAIQLSIAFDAGEKTNGLSGEGSGPEVLSVAGNGKLPKDKDKSNRFKSQAKDIATAITGGRQLRATDTYINVPEISKCITGGGKSGGIHSEMQVIQLADSSEFGKQPRQQNRVYSDEGVIPSIQQDQRMNIQTGDKLRRLTEVEKERLHGFKDNWTKYGVFNGKTKIISDTQRGKLLGNAVSPVCVTDLISKIEF